MKMPSLGPVTLASLAALALGSSACAEVYVPRPSGAVVITSNGSTGYRVYKHGEEMGSEWSVRDAVSGDPRAEGQADKAQSERIGSIVTGILGAISVGVGVGLATDYAVQSNSNNAPSQGLEYAGLALLGGGIVLAIVGGSLQGAAHTHTFNAVNIYNDDLAARGVEIRPLPATVYVTPGPGYAPQPVAPGIVPAP
jgi:hypothetical protein